MCCLNVLKGENEFQNYYRRKKAEGKSIEYGFISNGKWSFCRAARSNEIQIRVK
jgi:hypothetical protein